MNKTIRLLILASSILAISCRDRLPSPFFTKGILYGHVSIWGQYSGYALDTAGVKVLLRGPYGNKTVFTDTNGVYIFPGLGNGTYELNFTKQSYGTMKFFGIQVFGTDTITQNCTLYYSFEKVAPPEIISQVPSSDDPYTIIFSIPTVPCCSKDPVPGLVFFVDDQEEVSCTKYKYSVMTYANNIEYHFNCSPDYNPFFQHGKVYYIKGYPFNPVVWNDQQYWDPYRGITIYPTMNYSAGTTTRSFTVP